MKIKIATTHSNDPKRKSLVIEMQGGDPYFSYIWINDMLHVLRTKTGHTFSLHRVTS